MPQGFNGTRWQSVVRVSNRVGATASALGFPDAPGWLARPRPGLCARSHLSGWSSLVSRWGTTGGTGRPLGVSPQYPGRGLPGDRGGRCCPDRAQGRAPLSPPIPLHWRAHAPVAALVEGHGMPTPPCRQSRSGEAPRGFFSREAGLRASLGEVARKIAPPPRDAYRGRLCRPRWPLHPWEAPGFLRPRLPAAMPPYMVARARRGS